MVGMDLSQHNEIAYELKEERKMKEILAYYSIGKIR